MSKRVKVEIGNKELNLRGDEEQLILKCAELVNTTLIELGYKKDEDLNLTYSLLAALNIAEKFIRLKEDLNKSEKLLNNELVEMSNYLNNSFQQ